MSVQSTRRRRKQSATTSTAPSTVRRKTKTTKSKSKSPTRRVRRTALKERPPFIPVTIEAPPDGYFYLELISQDMHAVPAVERELLLRTSCAERCYMQSRIPVYRIPASEAGKMDPWPFIQGQTKYAGCSLELKNKEKETFVFRNGFNQSYLLKGTFEKLRPVVASTVQISASNSPKRRRRSKINAE